MLVYSFWLKPVIIIFYPRPEGRGNCSLIIITNTIRNRINILNKDYNSLLRSQVSNSTGIKVTDSQSVLLSDT